MKNQLYVAFDLDGVLVDTIETLYESYLSILAGFGATGTTDEFDFLNGKNVNEIAEHLTKVHQLPCGEPELIALFQKKFDSLYSEVELVPGARSILTFLKSQDARIALASSSSRKNINVILKRFDLEPFFELIVSGDDVQKAKPSPDIYNRVKHHFKTNRCYVVEDSSNGILAARSAGLITVLFDPGIPTGQPNSSFVVHELREIEQIIRHRPQEPIFISTCAHVEIESSPIECTLSVETKAEVEKIWRGELSKKPTLFNGPILSYAAHRVTEDDTLVIQSFVSEYRYVVAQMHDRDLSCVHPLAVSGVVVDKNQNYLIGKRSDDVTEYPGRFEFVPSGGISAERITHDVYRHQLVVELEEETGIEAASIRQISPLGLIYDPQHSVYDIALLVELAIEIDLSTLKSCEYSSFSLHNASSLKAMIGSADFVPTSRVIHSSLPELAGRLPST